MAAATAGAMPGPAAHGRAMTAPRPLPSTNPSGRYKAMATVKSFTTPLTGSPTSPGYAASSINAAHSRPSNVSRSRRQTP